MDHGTVPYQDKTLTLTQQPYIRCNSRDLSQDVYAAHAVDEDDNDYMVIWEITNVEAIDESEACDWTKYTVRKA